MTLFIANMYNLVLFSRNIIRIISWHILVCYIHYNFNN